MGDISKIIPIPYHIITVIEIKKKHSICPNPTHTLRSISVAPSLANTFTSNRS